MIDPRNHKVGVFGLQGSGKTHYAKELVKRNGLRVLVFSPHRADFLEEGDNFYYYTDPNPANFERFLGQAKQLAQKGLIDGVLVDEFEMVIRNNMDVGPNALDVFANHRHYNMCVIAISRRPQDIPAYFVESCRFLVCFCIDGENVIQKFNRIFKGWGDKIASLPYESRKYYVKEIGRPPVLYNAL